MLPEGKEAEKGGAILGILLGEVLMWRSALDRDWCLGWFSEVSWVTV